MKATRAGFRMLRREQLLQEIRHDSYQPRRKLPEPARCPTCQAVFRRGRWTRGAAVRGTYSALCPACRRLRERLPAGYVMLSGPFLREHHDEIVALVRRCEDRESSRHVLERIMVLKEMAERVLVTTTGVHLARRIGDAVHDAYKGRLHYRYNKADKLLRVDWSR